MTHNSTPKDTENMSAQKVVHEWSSQHYSEEPQVETGQMALNGPSRGALFGMKHDVVLDGAVWMSLGNLTRGEKSDTKGHIGNVQQRKST